MRKNISSKNISSHSSLNQTKILIHLGEIYLFLDPNLFILNILTFDGETSKLSFVILFSSKLSYQVEHSSYPLVSDTRSAEKYEEYDLYLIATYSHTIAASVTFDTECVDS